MSRQARIDAFLARQGYATAGAAPLAQDASFRRYLRLTGGPRPAVLMDAPPPEDVRPFLRIAEHLAGIGVAVPAIIAADAEAGLVLEEDLGDALLSSLLDRADAPAAAALSDGAIAPAAPALLDGADAPAATATFPLPQGNASSPPPPAPHPAHLLDAAVDVLVAIQRAAPPPGLPPWDAPTMAQTALGTLLDWWWPATFGAAPPRVARDDFAAALAQLLRPVAEGPRGFTHRDYFAGNLLWLPQRDGLHRIGVLDFQSAAIGHPAYDLVSLLQDARRDIPPDLAARARARYLAARPDLDPVAFDAAYAVCAAQRHLRVACQWVRLAQRDGRRQYLAHGPRTWRLLGNALRHPAVAPLAEAMDRWIPPHRRANPEGLTA